MSDTVRVRYAPSPTGLQHIGGIRTALYNYFFARSNGGKFILRVEDTDRERYSDESLEDLYSTLDWLGIDWDEGPGKGGEFGPYVQSERLEIYQKYAKQLVEMGKAYYCYCTEERLEQLRKKQEEEKSPVQGYDRHCRNLSDAERLKLEAQGLKPVIRLKVPTEGTTTFHDILMGDISRDNKDISPDPVLLKSDGYPTYHLANVIDDHLMGITHIMRAQEWIPSGPLHILLYDAFGWKPPVYCHLPMVMGKEVDEETGKIKFAKLSKRHGSTSVRDFRAKGYLPEALLNYVTLVGWSYDGEKEFFTSDELKSVFDLNKINKAPGVFDYKKLDWFNGQYIRRKSDSELTGLVMPYMVSAGIVSSAEKEKVLSFVGGIKDRLTLLSDVVEMCGFVKNYTKPSVEMLIPKKADKETAFKGLSLAYDFVKKAFSDGADDKTMEAGMSELAQENSMKNAFLFNPLRIAVTGSQVSPPPFSCIRLLGTDQAYKRIEQCLKDLA